MTAKNIVMAAAGASADTGPLYIEDVFSTYLHTGNGSTQTITNGVNLAGNGGLVWVKQRGQAGAHALFDTVRGATKRLATNGTNAEATVSGVTAFGATGFTSGADAETNGTSNTYVSWSFRRAAKFFDVVTYTGNGVTGRAVPHTLGSAPGFVIIKATSTTSNWFVYHRGSGGTQFWTQGQVNSTAALSNMAGLNWLAPTSTNFYPHYIRDSAGNTSNANGVTYVAYLFAHDAGGFGAAGTDNVISCGAYTGNGSATGPTITLGYEPQWLLIKNANAIANWYLVDTTRVFSHVANETMPPNLSDAPTSNANFVSPTATGFRVNNTSSLVNSSSTLYVYVAIRRGPMKAPTSGTSVFAPRTYTGNGGNQNIATGFSGDAAWIMRRNIASDRPLSYERLRAVNYALHQNSVSVEVINSPSTAKVDFDNTNLVLVGNGAQFGSYNTSGATYIAWVFKRALGFFDMVCYRGTGGTTGQNVTHNLGAVPEMMIIKCRDSANDWIVYHSALGATNRIVLNSTTISAASTLFNNTTPTSTQFSVNASSGSQTNGLFNYVAFLFASLPGISKVGSYTGTGAAQTINCGFTTGVRFILIKRTDASGGWYVFDTARGIGSGNDPYMLLNTTNADLTTTDYISAQSVGFGLTATAPADLNASGGNYIYLAIA